MRLFLWVSLLAVSCALAGGFTLNDAVLEWVQSEYGHRARARVEALRTLIRSAAADGERHKLERVNEFFNRIPYRSDWHLWDQEDYWATPLEMLGIDGADCEDFAIAKYFALTEMGVPAERLRITYVKSLTLDEPHMVLAYYASDGAEPLILDSLTDRIQPAGERDDLVPVYSFNGDSLWLAASRNQARRVGGSGRIKLWTGLQARMVQELGR